MQNNNIKMLEKEDAEKKERENALDVLPIELWLKIFKSTDDDSLTKSLVHVCKTFHGLVHAEFLDTLYGRSLRFITWKNKRLEKLRAEAYNLEKRYHPGFLKPRGRSLRGKFKDELARGLNKNKNYIILGSVIAVCTIGYVELLMDERYIYSHQDRHTKALVMATIAMGVYFALCSVINSLGTILYPTKWGVAPHKRPITAEHWQALQKILSDNKDFMSQSTLPINSPQLIQQRFRFTDANVPHATPASLAPYIQQSITAVEVASTRLDAYLTQLDIRFNQKKSSLDNKDIEQLNAIYPNLGDFVQTLNDAWEKATFLDEKVTGSLFKSPAADEEEALGVEEEADNIVININHIENGCESLSPRRSFGGHCQ